MTRGIPVTHTLLPAARTASNPSAATSSMNHLGSTARPARNLLARSPQNATAAMSFRAMAPLRQHMRG
uniref:Uncharacterized protein n=1 Tax=Arundo donax TaxID=35708 RepID=A0A0A9B578_ARUDO